MTNDNPPSPAIGQVWRLRNNALSQVIYIGSDGTPYMFRESGGAVGPVREWPIEGALLVSGEGAPWPKPKETETPPVVGEA